MLLTTTFKFAAEALDNLKFASEFAVTISPELSRVDKVKVLSLATVTEYLSAPPSFPVSFTFALPPSTVTVSLVPEVNEFTSSVEIFAPALIAAALIEFAALTVAVPPASFVSRFNVFAPDTFVKFNPVVTYSPVTLIVSIFWIIAATLFVVTAAFKISESVVVESTSTSVLFNVFNVVALNKSLFAVPANVSVPVVNVPV